MIIGDFCTLARELHGWSVDDDRQEERVLKGAYAIGTLILIWLAMTPAGGGAPPGCDAASFSTFRGDIPPVDGDQSPALPTRPRPVRSRRVVVRRQRGQNGGARPDAGQLTRSSADADFDDEIARLRAYVVRVQRYVALRVRNPADAADIAQQTLLRAWVKRDSYGGGDFLAWLSAIANHLIVDWQRAQCRARVVEGAPAELVEMERASRKPSDGVREICELGEQLRHWLDCADRTLRLEEQVAVLLADIYGYRDKDSAAVLEMQVPSFRVLLHRARKRHAESMARDGAPAGNTVAAGQLAVTGQGIRNAARCLADTSRSERARPHGKLSLVALRAQLLQGLVSALDLPWELLI